LDFGIVSNIQHIYIHICQTYLEEAPTFLRLYKREGSYTAMPFFSSAEQFGTAVLIAGDIKCLLLAEIEVASAEDVDSRCTTKTCVGGTVGLALLSC
jgi:hypothetical protein